MDQNEKLIERAISSLPPDITDAEANFFNTLPLASTYTTLRKLVEEEKSEVLRSRAFDALLKLEELDKVAFLIDFFDNAEPGWALACCKRLAQFKDKRAVLKLMEIARNNDDPDLRYIAVEGLGDLGDESAIPTLTWVVENDDGVDYEGFEIREIAKESIRKLNAV